MRNHKIFFIVIFTLAILLSTASCNQTSVIPTATVAPTDTLAPTATATATATPTNQPINLDRQVLVGDLERSYLLYIPSGLDSLKSVPVVFAFHGYSNTPKDMQGRSGMNNIADLANFIVIYPMGYRSSWNAGEIGPGDAIAQNIDESAFIRSILSDLDTIANIDTKRIYALGFSQGGSFVYRLACEMSDTFAAIASVSGGMEFSNCTPTHAVSVLHIHGLADTLVPFNGGGVYNLSPIENGINTWVELNKCASPASEEKYGSNVNRIVYAPCQDGTTIELYTLDSGDHGWPYDFPMTASEFIWEFFAAHPKP